MDRTLRDGHDSVYERTVFTFNIEGIPKFLAMILNNEPPYSTSERSARYTKMD
ncbi:FAD-dependent thymidylate synthase [Candidatus Dojkabacteria bacterium]|nr:FAD-dependent thymidylate synthase [Candidatus Dojkabacteria bacterium]